MQYAWKHKMFPLKPLETTDGQPVEVIDTGLQNTDAGPDFFNAKVKIGGTVWIGNVEIHEKSSYWTRHGHDRDAAYDNVVLHVASAIDADVVTAAGRRVAQVRMDVPQGVKDNYAALLHEDRYPPCYAIVPSLGRLTTHSLMSRLLAERLEQKTAAINHRVELCGGSWESALFVTMARNYGFGVNGDAFERWAMSVPLAAAGHHRDDLFQIEALFMGQAGASFCVQMHCSTKAANSRRLSSLVLQVCSGCHCTPQTNRLSGIQTASTRPSGEQAIACSPGARALMA